ncbi:MAG: hypothetical protein K2X77_32520 [Candidatus Obscuribacterales bacterium]|jgi:uncharacterized protein YxjI|nr:hypothetical protein [Candidatus Obscuribacterales bacterium]
MNVLDGQDNGVALKEPEQKFAGKLNIDALEPEQNFDKLQSNDNPFADLEDRQNTLSDWRPNAQLDLMTGTSKIELPMHLVAAGKATPPVERTTMAPRFFTWGWTFDIKDANGKSDGVVDQKLLNWTKTFEYQDKHGNKLATGRENLFSWGTRIDITDAQGKPIGTLKEDILKSWWKTYTTYSILDPAGKEIAKSEKVEWLGTDFTLKNPKGEVIATIHRPWINWVRDNWTIDIHKPGEVDKRILYMIPAYKTSVDYERKQKQEEEEAEEERKRKENDDN